MDETKTALHGKCSGEDAGRERNQAQEYERHRSIAGIEKAQHQDCGSRREPPDFPLNGLLRFDGEHGWTRHQQAQVPPITGDRSKGLSNFLLDGGLRVSIEPRRPRLHDQQGPGVVLRHPDAAMLGGALLSRPRGHDREKFAGRIGGNRLLDQRCQGRSQVVKTPLQGFSQGFSREGLRSNLGT